MHNKEGFAQLKIHNYETVTGSFRPIAAVQLTQENLPYPASLATGDHFGVAQMKAPLSTNTSLLRDPDKLFPTTQRPCHFLPCGRRSWQHEISEVSRGLEKDYLRITKIRGNFNTLESREY